MTRRRATDSVDAVTRKLLICLFLLFAIPAHARFGADPNTWLKQMETALNSVNYRGTFVYIHGDQAETMLVYHSVGEDGTRERLVSLNGSAREVLRNEDEVKCILPDARTVYVEKRHQAPTLAQGIPLNALRSSEYYNFQLLDEGRIAGRSSRLVAISPRDGYRYGYRLWLDEHTALPLRSELVNNEGQPIEKMMFTEIEIGVDIDESLLKPSVSGDGYTWHVREGGKEKLVGNRAPLAFESLPPGYELVRTELREGGEGERPSWHLVLSDGLASVSLFAEPVQADKPALEGLSKLGAVNAYGVALPEHHVTIVGEVPEATVKAIGEAVRFAGQ